LKKLVPKPAQYQLFFFDEVDSIAIDRSKTDSNIDMRFAAQFLTLLDGFKSRKNIVVIAATNRMKAIDIAFRRSGRFGIELEFPMPDTATRKQILEIMLHNISNNLDFQSLAEKTEKYSGADLQGIVQEAIISCTRRVCKWEGNKFIKIEEVLIEQKDFGCISPKKQ